MEPTDTARQANSRRGRPRHSAVHVFTACGAGCALLALIAAVRRRLAADVRLARHRAHHRRHRRHVCAAASGRRSAAALVGRRARSRGRYPHLRVRAGLCASRPAGCCRSRLAIPLGIVIVVTGSLYFADRLMKTSDYYFRGFPGAVERGGVLSVPAQAAALARRRIGRGAGGADVRAVSRRASGPHRAFARADAGGARSSGRCSRAIAVAKDLDPGFWTRAGLCILAVYFVGVGFLAPGIIRITKRERDQCRDPFFSSPAAAAASARRPRGLRPSAATTSQSITCATPTRRPTSPMR